MRITLSPILCSVVAETFTLIAASHKPTALFSRFSLMIYFEKEKREEICDIDHKIDLHIKSNIYAYSGH